MLFDMYNDIFSFYFIKKLNGSDASIFNNNNNNNNNNNK